MPIYGTALIPHPFMYLPDGWDTGWKAAVTASAATPATIMGVGDSIFEGQGSTDYNNKGWFSLVRDNLIARYGRYGECFPSGENIHHVPSYVGTPPYVVNETVTDYPATGPFGGGWANTAIIAAPGPMLTFTSPWACTDIDIIWSNLYAAAGGNSWVYTVDGGADQVVPEVAPSAAHVAKITLAGLANAVHVIVIKTQTVGYALYLWGINCRTGLAGGIGSCKNGQSGRISSTILSGNPQLPVYAFLGGKATVGTYTFGFPCSPDLFIWSLGVNDTSASSLVSPDVTAAAVQGCFHGCRRSKPNGSLMALIPWMTASSTGDAPGTLNALLYDQTVRAIYDVCRSFGAAVVDINAKWGDTQVARGFGGSVHPNDAGHADMAATVLSIL